MITYNFNTVYSTFGVKVYVKSYRPTRIENPSFVLDNFEHELVIKKYWKKLKEITYIFALCRLL